MKDTFFEILISVKQNKNQQKQNIEEQNIDDIMDEIAYIIFESSNEGVEFANKDMIDVSEYKN